MEKIEKTDIDVSEEITSVQDVRENAHSNKTVQGSHREALAADHLFPKTNVHIDIRTPFLLEADYTGRKTVLASLVSHYQQVAKQKGLGFSMLLGEAGMGKSRTLGELSSVISKTHSPPRIFTGQCSSNDRTYAAISMLLRARFNISVSDTIAEAHVKMEAAISNLVQPSRVTEVTHLLAHLIRCPYPNSTVVGPLAASHQQLEVRTFLALKRFLQADADVSPLVLYFENLEHADSATINLLHFLVSGLTGSPILIVGTATAKLYEYFPHFGDTDIELKQLNLEALSKAECEDLFSQLCQTVTQLPASLKTHASKLGGSPRAIFELVRYLLETQVIKRQGNGWTLDQLQLTKIPLPKKHTDLVTARIRTMPTLERSILQHAAIVGETFWLDSIVALIRSEKFSSDDPDGPTLSEIASAGDQTKASVSQVLTNLLHQEWLIEVQESSKPGEHEYRFSYPMLWSKAYDDSEKNTRKFGHLRTAQWLELRPNGRAPEPQEDIGRHLELAGDVRGAARRYRRAADHARKNFFNDRAIRLYSHALKSLGQADQAERIHLWHDLGSVYELKGDYDAAIGAFERMLRLSWVCASRTKAAVAFNKMGRVWRKKGDLQLSIDYLSRGLQLFEQADDGRGIGGSLDDIGQVYYYMGDFTQAYEKVTAGLQRRGQRGDKRSIATSLSTLGNIQKDRGFFDEAHNCHREALELRLETGDRVGVATSHNNLAIISYERGALEDARMGWELALKEAEDIGALPLQAHALANLGELALVESRFDEARGRLSECIHIAVEIADRRLEVESRRNMARLDHQLGNSSSARDQAHKAHTVASDAGLRDYQGRSLLTLAEVFGGTTFDATQTDEDAQGIDAEPTAEGYYKQGIDLLREIGADTELAKGLESYGHYKVEQGHVAEGKQLLQQSLNIYHRLGLQHSQDLQSVIDTLA